MTDYVDPYVTHVDQKLYKDNAFTHIILCTFFVSAKKLTPPPPFFLTFQSLKLIFFSDTVSS